MTGSTPLPIANFRFLIAWFGSGKSKIKNQKSEIGNDWTRRYRVTVPTSCHSEAGLGKNHQLPLIGKTRPLTP
jgi:hypothetical protein